MSRRYDHAMQKHGKARAKKQKKGLPMKGFDFQTVSLMKDEGAKPKETDYEASWRRDLFSPEEDEEDKPEPSSTREDIPLTVHAVGIGEQNPTQIGQEFSGITDRISKLLTEYESMYDDKDQQGYAAMQEHLSGQMAMESLLSDYKTLCRERDELLYSLQDSLDVDEEEVLDELEAMSRKEHYGMDLEGAQLAIQDTFQNVKDTTAKLKNMNKKMLDLSKQGEATESLELEKRQLERELQMYKKMAVQQRKDIFNRRSSIRRDDTQQWKLVAGEMVDILNMVRHEGKLDKESLEKELNRIILTLNTQNEYIENLKRDISKQERNAKNFEKDKSRLNNDKLLAEEQLKAKNIELKQCKQYLRKILCEKKDLEDKYLDGEEIDLAEAVAEELKGVEAGGASEDVGMTSILQAQVRDARKVTHKLEEENRELQRKLAALSGPKEVQDAAEAIPPGTETEGSMSSETSTDRTGKGCPTCHTYKARLVYSAEELKKKEENIERLKEDLNNLRVQLSASKKDIARIKPELALVEGREEEEEEEGLRSGATSANEASMETTADTPRPSSEQSMEAGEKRIKEKSKKGSALSVPGKKPKQKSIKSPKKQKRTKKVTSGRTEKEKDDGDDEEDEEIDEEEDEDGIEDGEKKEAKTAKKKDTKRFGVKRRDLVVGECREEKAPYVKVREARMVTLADKGTQTSQYDRKMFEGMAQRHAGVRHPHDRRKSLADAIMSGLNPSVVEDETRSTMHFIRDEANRLCDEISGFVEFGFDLVQYDAKTTRTVIDTHLGEKAADMLESSEDGPVSIDKAKAAKAIMPSDNRRMSILASKKRRPSIQLERRGTLRRDSKAHLFGTEGMFGRKREDSIGADAEGARPESTSLTEQKEDTLAAAGIERPVGQSSDSLTDQRDTTVTKEQGPPEVRHNTLFPDQAQYQGEENRGSKELQYEKDTGGERSSKVLQEVRGDRSSKDFQQGQEAGGDRSSKELLQGQEIMGDPSLKVLQQGQEVGGDRSSRVLQHGQEVGGDRSTRVPQQGKDVEGDRSLKELQHGKGYGVEDYHDESLAHVTERSTMPRAKENALTAFRGETSGIMDASFVKRSKWSTLKNFMNSVQAIKGGGCSHVMTEVMNIAEGSGAIPSEEQIKEQVTVMAQHVIDTLQSTAQVLNCQLEAEISLYEKFFSVWSEYRDKRRPSDLENKDEVPVVGVKILSTLDERDTDAIKPEDSALFPPIVPQVSSYQTGGRSAIATAGLSQGGMMMIQGSGPKTVEPIPSSTSQGKIKKRGKIKNWSRKQLLLKQKEVLDKVLHVDARIEDLRNIFAEAEFLSPQRYPQQSMHHTRQVQGNAQATSQEFHLPFTARSVALPSLPQGLQVQGSQGLQIHGAAERQSVQYEKFKKHSLGEVPSEEEHDELAQLPSMSNTVWQRRQSIAPFPSQRTVGRSSLTEQSTKLPLLNINHFLKVGQ